DCQKPSGTRRGRKPGAGNLSGEELPMNWGALGIGLIVGFYWLRVLKLILKTRRQTGRNANLLPPEPLGRAIRIFWVPDVVIWITDPLLCAFSRHLPAIFSPLFHNASIQIIAIVIALAALVATMVCWKRMGKEW